MLKCFRAFLKDHQLTSPLVGGATVNDCVQKWFDNRRKCEE